MGWIGSRSELESAIKAHAQQNEDGSYMVRGGELACSFLGMCDEYVLSEEIEICDKNGNWIPLIPLISGGSLVTLHGTSPVASA